MKFLTTIFFTLLVKISFTQVFVNPSLTGTQGFGTVAPSWTTILPSPDLTAIPSGIAFTFSAPGASPSPDGGTFQLFGQSDGTTEAFGQTVSGFTIGESYVITYYEGNFGPCPYGGACYEEDGEIEVTISGVGTFTSGNILSVSDEWLEGCIPFIATAETHTISFAAHRIVPSGITWLACDYPQISLSGGGGGGIDDFFYLDSVLCIGDLVSLPTIDGDLSGTFSSSPVGLDINLTTGEITPADSEPGTYTVTYALAGCFGGSSTTTIEIYNDAIANFEFANVCLGEEMFFTNTTTYTGVAPNWEWDFGGEGTSTDENPSFTFTDAGIYEVTLIADTGGPCNDTLTLEVTVHDNPIVTASASPSEICLGSSTTLTGSGADTYVWDLGVTDGVPFTPAAIGTYTYTVIGTVLDGACSASATVDVEVYDSPTVIANVDDDAICLGESVIFTGSGADTYVWDMGVTDGVSFSPLSVGITTYTVTGTIGDGDCSNTASIDVEVFDLPIVIANVNDETICLGESVIFTGEGADTYTWDMGVTDGILFTPLLVGTETYTVTGTNASNGCQNTASIEVEVFNAPNVVAHVDEIEICLGETVIFSGSGADTYTWDMGVTNGTPFTPMSLGLQTYTVTGSVAGLTCTDTDQINVTVNALPTILFTADTTKVCIPYTINFSSSNSGASFEWEFGDGTSATGPTTSHTYMNPGSFDVTLTVTNAASCINSETYPAYIIADNLPVASFSYSPTVIDVSNTNVEFTNTSIGADTYEWNFSDGSAISTVMHPTHQFPEVGNAQYSVELVAKNNAGCIATYEQLITIDDILSFYIPNAFTPDGDLFNDTFLPIFDAGLDIYDYHLIIFNRWGETVFESFNVAYGWDGTYGSSNTVEDGTYIWQIEYGVTMSDKKYVMNGHVTILK